MLKFSCLESREKVMQNLKFEVGAFIIFIEIGTRLYELSHFHSFMLYLKKNISVVFTGDKLVLSSCKSFLF